MLLTPYLLIPCYIELGVVDSKGAPGPVPTIVIEDTANGGKKLTSRDYGTTSILAKDEAITKVPDRAHSVQSSAVPASAVSPPQYQGAGMDGVPGALPTKKQPEVPEWFQVGWRQVSGIDDPSSTSPEARRKAALALFLREKFYGDWYHSAGIIIFVRYLFVIRKVRSKLKSLGCSIVSFHDSFPSWLGLVNRHPGFL